VWMRMPGQTWLDAAASFLSMWVVMMVAMMLPSLIPMLWRYHQAVGRPGETRLHRLTVLIGVGYFFVWTVVGMAVFPLGVALAAVEMQQPALARAVPITVGVVVLMAGTFQLTAWKVRHLAICRETPGRSRTLPADAGTAWRQGLRLGLHCSHCCVGLMAILLVAVGKRMGRESLRDNPPACAAHAGLIPDLAASPVTRSGPPNRSSNNDSRIPFFPLAGETQTARRPLEKPRFKTSLQLRHALADRRRYSSPHSVA
jgi:hypothetical protein